jgi:hypothetical protein
MPPYELQHSTDGLSKLIAAETEKRADPWHYCLREFQGEIFNGLTTAACVWVTASMGAACAVAQWQIVVIGVVLVFVVLVFGGPFEKAIDRRWPSRPTQIADQPPDTTR